MMKFVYLHVLLLSISVACFTQNYPFPQQVNYAYGIKPNAYSQATMNADVQTLFQSWRSIYLTTSGCIYPNTKRITALATGNNESYSEGISYGMAILVYMDNETNNTRMDFDAVFRYYKSYLNIQGLMKWKINSDGSTTATSFAGDGDEEIAFQLLMADKQWGSNGSIDYLNEADTIIKRLYQYNIQPNYNFADGGGGWIFPAYFMPAYWKEFARVTGNSNWNNVVSRAYTLLNNFYLGTTGLIYDTFDPSYNAVDVAHQNYGYDACRVPWRICTDYLWNGSSQNILAKDYPTKLARWAKVKWSNAPANARSKYLIDGTDSATYCDYGQMVGPMMVGAMADTDRVWLNTLYSYCRSIGLKSNYYTDHLLMLTMIIATGNTPNFRDLVTECNDISVGKSVVSIYPNPSKGLFALSDGEAEKIEVYGLLGELILKKMNSDFFDLSEHPAGIYIVKIYNGPYTILKKVMINR